MGGSEKTLWVHLLHASSHEACHSYYLHPSKALAEISNLWCSELHMVNGNLCSGPDT